jgi:hypothetical protein
MTTYTKQEIENLAKNALDQACLSIQDALGIKTGDVAGVFFCGEVQNIIESIFQDYVKTEIMFKTQD